MESKIVASLERFPRPAVGTVLGMAKRKPHATRPGWRYEVLPLLFKRARIVLSDGHTVDAGW